MQWKTGHAHQFYQIIFRQMQRQIPPQEVLQVKIILSSEHHIPKHAANNN